MSSDIFKKTSLYSKNNGGYMKIGFLHNSEIERFWSKIKTYKYTLVMTSFSVFVLFMSNVIHLKTFQHVVQILNELNRRAIDEIIFLSLFVVTGLLIDLFITKAINKKHIMKRDISYVVFKATMETLNDIMSNYIQSVQLYRSDMAGKSDPQIEKELDEVTELTLDKLRYLELTEEVRADHLYKEINILRRTFTKH
jgi:uncharacterized protein YacL